MKHHQACTVRSWIRVAWAMDECHVTIAGAESGLACDMRLALAALSSWLA